VGIAAVVAVANVVSRRELARGESAGESESESESAGEHEVESAAASREPEVASPRRELESEPETPVQRTAARMQAIRQDVHILEIQRLDARERADHEVEARLDREIQAARAEHERLRLSLATPEGI